MARPAWVLNVDKAELQICHGHASVVLAVCAVLLSDTWR